jgi:hypothetical protein
MDNLQKIEGYSSLRKDAQTSAVVNTDREALLMARKRRDQVLAEKQQITTLEDKVAELEKLVRQLLEGKQ